MTYDYTDRTLVKHGHETMLLGLLLAISIGNIALAFYTTQVFRRDAIHRGRPGQRAVAAEKVDSGPRNEAKAPPAQEQPPAVVPHERPAMPPLEPGQAHSMEDLFFHSVRLCEFLAEIDHSVVAGQAGEQNTEQRLASMWPQMAERAEPIANLLDRSVADWDESSAGAEAAELLSRLKITGTAILEQSRHLAAEMDTAEKRLSNAESGMHHLRDLFNRVCEFRDLCEDMLAEGVGIDPPADSTDGRLAFQRKAAELVRTEGDAPVCAVGFEIDHIGELNGMYGATLINALLDELGRKISASLPGHKAICRYHAQHYLVLVAGNAHAATTWADTLRQQVATTHFRGLNQSIAATLSGVVVPLTGAPEAVVSRIVTALGKSKEQGRNRIASEGKSGLQAVAATPPNSDSAESPLEPSTPAP